MKYQAISASICGVQGYIGQELFKLIQQHPHMRLQAVYSRDNENDVYSALPELAARQIPVRDYDTLVSESSSSDVIFLATPAEVSLHLVPLLANKHGKIIDLSGSLRLSVEETAQWYGLKHQNKDLHATALYGLSPWASLSPESALIANPGCYATAALMALLPLTNANILGSHIIIDAKSGISGAGKQVNANFMFCEIANNFYPYKIGKHQHTPEIILALKKFSGRNYSLQLTTALLPIERGISMTLYAQANTTVCTDEQILAMIATAYAQSYQNYPLVRYQEVGKGGNDYFLLALRNVVNGPYCHISYHVQHGHITLFATLDNLLKGAASQAIENCNSLFNLPVHCGLIAMKELI